MIKRHCVDCGKNISKRHLNTKRCEGCAKRLLRHPVGRLTKEQERLVRKYAGTMYIRLLAKKIGTSAATLKRWNRNVGIDLNALKYREEVVWDVLKYYEKHGKRLTQQKFPNVNVRSIVEKNYGKFNPRQIPWTESQIIQLAKFGGLLSYTAQVRVFNRPLAKEGSIKAAWSKRFSSFLGQINGMSKNRARFFVKKSCPFVEVRVWSERKKRLTTATKKVFLWVDMEKHLRKDCPDFVRDAVIAMAEFQRWLFDGGRVRTKIRAMIKSNEVRV